MTKAEFYEQRKKIFKEDYQEFKKTNKRDEALSLVAKKHNVRPGLVNKVIWDETYLTKSNT